MTELEMCTVLGMLAEPIENRVAVDAKLYEEILQLKQVFSLVTHQKQAIGTVNEDLWSQLLPWHSLN